jgi:hypothetical protein
MSDPVESGRDALNHWYGYPWYDPQTDGVRRVELSEPWNWDWLDPYLKWIPSFPTSVLQWLAWIAIGLLLAGIVYFLVHAYRRNAGQKRTKQEEPVGTIDRIEALPIPLPSIRTDLLAEARRCYEDGNYAQAIAYYFSYQLVRLDRRHVIRLDRGKTNRQYLREVGRQPAIRSLLEQTMTTFEEVYFGHRPIDRAQFETCWSRLDEFEHLIEGAVL